MTASIILPIAHHHERWAGRPGRLLKGMEHRVGLRARMVEGAVERPGDAVVAS